MAIILFALSATAADRQPIESRGAAGFSPPFAVGGLKPAAPPETVRLIVRFRQPVMAMAARRNALETRVNDLQRDVDIKIKRTFHRVLFGASVEVKREQRAEIAALPYVASVQEERILKPMLYESVPRIRADKVWELKGTRGKGIVVAVIDTGIDYNHVALGGGFGEGHKVIGGWDFVDNDADPIDTYGHGTFVAGIIAGDGDGLVGVAPDASLLAYRALAGFGGYESDVIAAIERTVDPNQDGDTSDHADIVNMSLGGLAYENDAVSQAVENATAAGILFCVAAGNGGDYGNVPTPAVAPSAIAVGAADDDDAIADFSSRGPSWNFGIKPEVSAPGVKIGSTWINGEYRELNGTSAAAPHITGVAALLKSLHRDWTPAQLKSAIVSTSNVLDEEVMIAGAGRVDALNAINTTTLVSPPLVNFGQDDPRIAVWTSTQKVTLRNLASSAKELTANVRGLRDGVEVTVTPATLTLDAGASAEVTIELSVTNAKVPTPLEGTLSFGGQIEWDGLHVPWAFVKGTFLRIEAPDAENGLSAYVLSKTKKSGTFGFYPSTRLFWPYEPVDIALSQYPSSRTNWVQKTVFAEQVDLAANPNVVLPMADAKYTITLETLGEKGQLLTAPETFDLEQFVFVFPHGRKMSFGQIPETRQLYSALSERVKVYPLHRVADVDKTTTYAAMYPPFTGLTQSVTRRLQPQWLRQDVQWLARGGFLTASVSMLRFPGPEQSYYLDGGAFFLMDSEVPQLTMYYNASPSPEIDLVSIISRWGSCYEPRLGRDLGCETLGDVYLYMNGPEIKVDNDVFLDVSPMAYRIPPGEPLVLGTAPVWPQVGFFRSSEYWGGSATWIGALGERRMDDTTRAVTLVRDSSGTIVGDTRTGHVGGQQVLPLGAYTIESTNKNYKIAGQAATATVNTSFDLRRDDGIYPLFTGLRIVDANDRQTGVLDRDSGAKLRFSIADVDGHSVTRRPPREVATRVEYRVTGTSEWRPLPAAIETRQYQNNSFLFGGVGTVWSADLSSITSNHLGPVDLRIHAEDAAGNDVQLRLEPAFFVGKDVRRRSSRH
ncbi:MAG TPA: S8 family serine peptidase [Thermoanaerobaculia bacterium]|nr:S8 family serine peptidase [Thermoanaerobaculia bacterium]